VDHEAAEARRAYAAKLSKRPSQGRGFPMPSVLDAAIDGTE
jgi:hypothetical protein